MGNARQLQSFGTLHLQEIAMVGSGTNTWHTAMEVRVVASHHLPGHLTMRIAISAFSNICIALYPTLIFWNLQMKTTKKVVLSLLFGSGVMYVSKALL